MSNFWGALQYWVLIPSFSILCSGISYQNKLHATVSPAITIATMLISLIRILRLGPEVSLNGSPTVSPTTVALCTSLPLPPKFPSSTYFLALSHAPPALAMKIASTKPLLSPPISNPNTPGTPNTRPVRIGATMLSATALPFRAARLS